MKNLLSEIGRGSFIFDVQALGHSWVISPKDGQEAAFNRLIDDLTFGDYEEFVALPVSDGRGAYVRAVITPSESR